MTTSADALFVEERSVGNHLSLDMSHSQTENGTAPAVEEKGVAQILRSESRVSSTQDIEIAVQNAVPHLTIVLKGSLETELWSEQFQSRRRCHKFRRTCGQAERTASVRVDDLACTHIAHQHADVGVSDFRRIQKRINRPSILRQDRQ